MKKLPANSKKIIIKKYMRYSLVALALLIDVAFLQAIHNIVALYAVIAVQSIVLSLACYRMTTIFNIKLSLLMMLFLGFYIEFLIHYLNIKMCLEVEYLYLIPLIIGALKSKNINSNIRFILISTALIIIGTLISIFNANMNFTNYVKSVIPILTFIMFYVSTKDMRSMEDIRSILSFIFVISALLTTTQAALGFHRDTRNGLYSVFGLNAYTFLIVYYPIYNLYCWFNKEKGILSLLFSMAVAVLLFVLTENKASLILLFVTLLAIAIMAKKISVKKIVIICAALLFIPISNAVLISYYPKLAYLNNYESIINYFTENNNKISFKYGRFESLSIVYSETGTTEKIIGSGIGTSTPHDVVFNAELNRNEDEPYFIRKYGQNHGFHLTTIGTIILDGGLTSLAAIIWFMVSVTKKAFLSIQDKATSLGGYITMATLIIGTFYICYSNVLSNYRTMAMIALFLGLCTCRNRRITENERT